MIIPVGDVNPRKSIPLVNYLLLSANVAVFFICFFRPEKEVVEIVSTYALVPNRWDIRTIFTSMFLHGDVVHLLGNMLFLWIAGDNVEDRLGHVPYLVFYLAAGAVGAAAHIGTATGNMGRIPTVGASGAISGVLGAYVVFFPTSRIKFLLFLFIFLRPFTLPSWGAIGIWVVTQVWMARHQLDGIAQGETALVAVFAHLGGFAFGFAAAFLARLFAPRPRRPSR